METIMKIIETGGLPTIIIFVLAFILIFITIERVLALYIRYSSIRSGSLEENTKDLIINQNYPDALQLCNKDSSSPSSKIIKNGLLAAENGREAMKSALSGSILDISHKCEIRLNYIGLIANVSTLLGLLGTITGLIKTFQYLSADVTDPTEKQQLLGSGISEAMYSTATGLVVGVAAMVIHSVLTSKSDNIVAKAQDLGLKFITWMEQSERSPV